MNCNIYINQIMLKASDELNAKDSDALKNHLQNCSECRDFAENMNVVTETYSKSDAVPHPSVMVNIRQAAENNLKAHELLWFPTHAVRLFAYAAILVFIAGTTLITIKPQSKNIQTTSISRKAVLQDGLNHKSNRPGEQLYELHQTERISELSTMVAMLSNSTEGDTEYQMEESENLEEFAEQLLEMQGFAVDDIFDDEAMLNLFAEPDPTTTQYRNIRGLPAKKCV